MKMFVARELFKRVDLERIFDVDSKGNLIFPEKSQQFVAATTGISLKLEKEFYNFSADYWDLDLLGNSIAKVPGTVHWVPVL